MAESIRSIFLLYFKKDCSLLLFALLSAESINRDQALMNSKNCKTTKSDGEFDEY